MLARLALALSLAACGDRGREITVEQYVEAALPGIDGFTVHVGDITAGAVSLITIKRTADGAVIAKGNLRAGDEMPFVLRENGAHVLTVVSYRDRIVGDEAKLRIEDRRPTSKHEPDPISLLSFDGPAVSVLVAPRRR